LLVFCCGHSLNADTDEALPEAVSCLSSSKEPTWVIGIIVVIGLRMREKRQPPGEPASDAHASGAVYPVDIALVATDRAEITAPAGSHSRQQLTSALMGTG
jgi:hypothetical protein